MTRVTGAVFVTDEGELMCWGCGEGIAVDAEIVASHVTRYVDAMWHHACLIGHKADLAERAERRRRDAKP